MKVYVASSWRNKAQQNVVAALRDAGHEVYDFKNPRPGDHGFAWSSIDPDWLTWTPQRFRECLEHPVAAAGFESDMMALRGCDACVLVLPCGRSAHLELGWAAGAGKRTLVLFTQQDEPELMYRMLDGICVSVEEVIANLAAPTSPGAGGGDRTEETRDLREDRDHWKKRAESAEYALGPFLNANGKVDAFSPQPAAEGLPEVALDRLIDAYREAVVTFALRPVGDPDGVVKGGAERAARDALARRLRAQVAAGGGTALETAYPVSAWNGHAIGCSVCVNGRRCAEGDRLFRAAFGPAAEPEKGGGRP